MRLRVYRIIVIVILLLVPGNAARAAEPLPGTCGLPDPTTSTLAFAGPALIPNLGQNNVSMAACQAMDLSTVYVYGCSPDYFARNGHQGALRLSLVQAGFHTPYPGSTTLLDVITHPGSGEIDEHGAQTFDSYLVQAVTGYLNSLYVDEYEFDVQEVLDGYHDGEISEGSFTWNNNGARGRDIVSSCGLIGSSRSESDA